MSKRNCFLNSEENTYEISFRYFLIAVFKRDASGIIITK